MPYRANTALWARYAAACPTCGLLVGFRDLKRLERHLYDLSDAGLPNDGQPELYEPDGIETCRCGVDDGDDDGA